MNRLKHLAFTTTFKGSHAQRLQKKIEDKLFALGIACNHVKVLWRSSEDMPGDLRVEWEEDGVQQELHGDTCCLALGDVEEGEPWNEWVGSIASTVNRAERELDDEVGPSASFLRQLQAQDEWEAAFEDDAQDDDDEGEE